MKQIGSDNMYKPRVDAANKSGINKNLVFILISFTFFIAFGLGFRSSEQNWFEPSPKNSANSALPADLDYETVEDVYDKLKVRFDGELDEQTLIDGLKHGLVEASGDEYTVYLSEEEATEFYSDLNGSFEGIGAELGLDNEIIVIVSPIKGFPAAEAGLRPQDKIIKIDGESAIGLSVEEAVLKIRGESGTEVVLTIERASEQIEVSITRATITIPSVEYRVLDDQSTGVIEVYRFAEDTASLAREAAEYFVDQNVESVILDVRSNSGGYVDAAVALASLWLDEGEVVFEQRSGDVVEGVKKATGAPLLKDMPTVVLINQGSASASEIVAGALKDHQVATIVGMTSYGKGSVQELAKLGDGSTLKVTIARWFTPNGVNIDETGISPDEEVEYTEENFENGTDPQLDKAKSILR